MAGLIYFGVSFWLGMAVWLLLAIGIGLLLARWWALLLAAIPYPLGVGAGLMSGRIAFLGESWELVALVSLLIGFCGIAVGLLLNRLTGISVNGAEHS